MLWCCCCCCFLEWSTVKNIDYIELNASAFMYFCTIGQVHLLVSDKLNQNTLIKQSPVLNNVTRFAKPDTTDILYFRLWCLSEWTLDSSFLYHIIATRLSYLDYPSHLGHFLSVLSGSDLNNFIWQKYPSITFIENSSLRGHLWLESFVKTLILSNKAVTNIYRWWPRVF